MFFQSNMVMSALTQSLTTRGIQSTLLALICHKFMRHISGNNTENNTQAHTSNTEWQLLATSKTASSPPSSLSFSLKLPPLLRTVPEVSEWILTEIGKWKLCYTMRKMDEIQINHCQVSPSIHMILQNDAIVSHTKGKTGKKHGSDH